MNIKDYLHLYLGCEVETTIKGKYVHPYGSVDIDIVDADSYENLIRHLKLKEDYQKDGLNDYDWVSLKLILRPLWDMTEEEQIQLQLKVHPNGYLMDAMANEQRYFLFETTRQLLSKGFDIFNLIDAGLAIDKTKFEHAQ